MRSIKKDWQTGTRICGFGVRIEKKLTEIHDATIYHDKQIWAGCSFIGEYSSKEKALKVLDEIQELIHFNAKDNGFTYQMPTDDEEDDF